MKAPCISYVTAIALVAMFATAMPGQDRDWTATLADGWTPATRQAVHTTLMSGSDSQATACLEALAHDPPPEAAELIADSIRNRADPALREAGLQALGGLDAVAADHLPVIRAMLDNEEPEVRRRASAVLSDLKDHGAIDLWIDRLDDADPSVSESAHAALVDITGRKMAPESTAWKNWWTQTDRNFQQQFRRLVPHLASRDPAEVRAAIQRLSMLELHDHLLAEALAATLTHPDPSVRDMARGQLKLLEGPLAHRVLTRGAFPSGASILDPALLEPGNISQPTSTPSSPPTPVEQASGLWMIILPLVVVLSMCGVFLIIASRRQRSLSETEREAAKLPGRDPRKRSVSDRTRRIMSNMKRISFSK